MKHTKGPWHVNAIGTDSLKKTPRIIGDASTRIGVDYYSINNYNATVGKSYRPADAALIAAAPELLEALKDLTEYLEPDSLRDQENDPRLRMERDAAQERAIAAISKAEGR